MAGVTDKYGLYGVKLDATLMRVTQQNLDNNTEISKDPNSGQPHAKHVGISAINPAGQITTHDIKAFLDNVPFVGVDIGTSWGAGLSVYGQKRTATGRSTLGRRFTLGTGLIVGGVLSFDHNAHANITGRVFATSADGTSAPYTQADGITLPSGLDADADVRYRLWKITLGNVALTHVQSASLDFGHTVDHGVDGDSDGVKYPRWAGRVTSQPVLTLRGIDPTWQDATRVPLEGLSGTHANTTLYLRKEQNNGLWVAEGTAEHIAITMHGLVVVQQPLAVAGQDAAETTVEMHGAMDNAGNPPLIFNTAAAIT